MHTVTKILGTIVIVGVLASSSILLLKGGPSDDIPWVEVQRVEMLHDPGTAEADSLSNPTAESEIASRGELAESQEPDLAEEPALRLSAPDPTSPSAEYSLHPNNDKVLGTLLTKAQSSDPKEMRVGLRLGVTRSIATILEFEGRGGDWRGQSTSMKPANVDERVFNLNGAIFRFDKRDFPLFDEVISFEKSAPRGTPAYVPVQGPEPRFVMA